jgi:squalene synthase HpnC
VRPLAELLQAPSERPPDDLPPPETVLGQAGAENFPVASLVLPRATRQALLDVYGFARLVDDVGDEAAGDRLALLDWLAEDLRRAPAGGARHPLLRRLGATIRRHGLDLEPFERLIEANRRDQLVARYATFEELVGYCELSANPVGRLVLAIFGLATAERIALSDAVCTGLQIVEHLQDVGEDYARGRIYVPGEDLAGQGVREQELGAERTTAALARVLALEGARARELLAAGPRLVASMRGRARLAVAGFVAGGVAALDALEAAGYEVLAAAPRPGARRRLATLRRTLREARRA